MGTLICSWDANLPDSNKHFEKLQAMIHALRFTASNLAHELASQRHYAHVRQGGSGTQIELDPRFLVFEFVANIVLRDRQIQLVNDFVTSAKAGQSSVHQMIMGAGKTSVVCPLLVLMLADGESLVTQVVLDSLLFQSRDVMRAVFSRVIKKKCYTLTFDRSYPHNYDTLLLLLQKLQRAKKDKAVVCTTPAAIKSLMLKYVLLFEWLTGNSRYIDLLSSVEFADKLLFIPENFVANSLAYTDLKRQAQILHEGEWMADMYVYLDYSNNHLVFAI